MSKRNPKSVVMNGHITQYQNKMFKNTLDHRQATANLINNSRFFSATHSKITKQTKGEEINILSLEQLPHTFVECYVNKVLQTQKERLF